MGTAFRPAQGGLICDGLGAVAVTVGVSDEVEVVRRGVERLPALRLDGPPERIERGYGNRN